MTQGLTRVTAALLVGVLGVGGLAACDKATPPPTVHAVVVVAERANMPALVSDDGTPTANALKDVVARISNSQGDVLFVRSDGAPVAVGPVSLTIDTTSSTTRDDSMFANQNAIAAALKDGVRATVGEADPITALDTVSRSATAGAEVDVFDNGLSTTGPLLMQTGLITQGADVGKLVKQLEQAKVLGSLKGLSITWYGLGETASPQGRVPAWALTQLQTLYSTLIKDAGGSVRFQPLTASGSGVAAPKVSVVPFPLTQVSGSGSARPSPPLARVLTDAELSFVSDSTAFKDAAQARATLGTVATQVKAGTYGTVFVYGCTARPKGSTDTRLTAFGLQRAQRVVAELKGLGVTSKLVAASFGWACPGYLVDSDANGNLIDALAAKNRRVIITSQQLQSAK